MTHDADSDYTELGLQRHLLHVLLSLSVDTRSRPQAMMAMIVIYYEVILEIPVRVGKWNWEGKENQQGRNDKSSAMLGTLAGSYREL